MFLEKGSEQLILYRGIKIYVYIVTNPNHLRDTHCSSTQLLKILIHLPFYYNKYMHTFLENYRVVRVIKIQSLMLQMFHELNIL